MKVQEVVYNLLGALVLLPVAAQAQGVAPGATPTSNPEAAAAPAYGDIIVTAQKRSQNLSDVPMSVTAITGDQLASKGISNVQDLARLTPGLSFVESGNSVPVYSLRGVGFFDTAIGSRPTVSVYVDEAPLPFSVMTTGASFDLERVEVLKGPQGTLFGQNATGGAINYIAAKPKDEPGAGITASIARFDTVNVQGYVTGPITSDLDARFAISTTQGNGWQKSYTRNDTLGSPDFTQARLLLNWRPSDRLKIGVNLNGFLDHGDTQAGQLIAVVPQVPSKVSAIPALVAYPVAPANDRAADWDAGAPLRKDNRFYQAVLRGDYEVTDDITLTSLTAYSNMRIKQLIDIDGTAINNALNDLHGHVSSVSEELRLSGHEGPLTWIVGGNYARDKSYEDDFFQIPYSTASQLTLPAGAFTAIHANGSQTFRTKAVFGNADYNIGKLITLHGGVRYTQADLDYETCALAGNASTAAGFTALYNRIRASVGLPALPAIQPGGCASLDANLGLTPLQGSFNQHNVSWRAGIDLKPAPHTLVYFNVSKGYKAGSIPITAGTSSNAFHPVSQESVLAYEAGFKISLFRRKVDLSGAAFDYEYNDKQLKGRIVTTPNVLGALEALVNVPRSRIRGAEGQVTVYPVANLSLTAAGTYLKSKVLGNFTNYTILGDLQNFGGDPFPYTPKWQFTFSGEYRVPVTSTYQVTLGADYTHRTKTSAGFGNEPLLAINAYGLLDLQAGFGPRDGRWEIQAFGRNVTNQYYWTNVAKFFDVARRLTGQPATYGARVMLKF